MISPFGRAALTLDLLPIGIHKWDLLPRFLDCPEEFNVLAQEQLDQMLLSFPSVGKEHGRCLLSEARAQADRELVELRASDFSLVTIFDGSALYPDCLKECYRPPLFLEILGDPSCLLGPAFAIVGTRKPTSEGIRIAEDMAGQLASAGFVIVSGLAYGIDKAAHAGCLDASGRTVAVLGSGIDQIYPQPHEDLARRIIEQKGTVVSEFHLHAQPTPYSFPQRNRVISGLSVGVLVVEAAQHSGSLLTANFALEQNRDVFAIPGSIYTSQHVGTNQLIKNGAKLVQSCQDILEEFPVLAGTVASAGVAQETLTPEEQSVLSAVSSGCVSVDLLCSKLSKSAQQILSILTALEIRGLLIREGPDRFAAAQAQP